MTCLRSTAVLLVAMVVLSCAMQAAAQTEPARADTPAAFHAFGERAGLEALVEVFMIELVDDPRTRPYFADVDQKRVKAMLVDQFCVQLGGPCTYTGKTMKEAHAQLTIHTGEFNALVECLQRAMDKRGIPFAMQNRLLAKLAPMHRDVVTPPK